MGVAAILHHLRLVWASLWSDAALLYRQELDLDIEKSSMAVVIQELVAEISRASPSAATLMMRPRR